MSLVACGHWLAEKSIGGCSVVMSTTRSAVAEEDLVLGGGIAPPVYETPFSVGSSRYFFKAYREYERKLMIRNSGQTVQRPLLKLSQLLPESV